MNLLKGIGGPIDAAGCGFCDSDTIRAADFLAAADLAPKTELPGGATTLMSSGGNRTASFSLADPLFPLPFPFPLTDEAVEMLEDVEVTDVVRCRIVV
jgi:hypothetical protein